MANVETFPGRDPALPPEPPHNYEAEQALLGAVLVDNDSYARVSAFLKPEHFYEPVHGRIYEAMQEYIGQGKVANGVTLKGLFDSDPALVEAGGHKYLGRLASNATTTINAKGYGETVFECWQARQALEHLKAHENELMAGQGHVVAELAAEFSGLMDGPGLTDTGTLGTYAKKALDAAEEAQRGTGLVGVPTGYKALESIIRGLKPGYLIYIAGRPSMGKSTLAANIAYNAALAGHSSLFVTLEMEGEQIAQVLLARRTGISVDQQESGDLDQNQWHRLVESTDDLAKLPITLDCIPEATVDQIWARAKAMKRRQGLDLLVVDYLGLIRANGRFSGLNEQVTAISKRLKAMARDLKVPVLVASQLNRDVERRDNKRPMLSDLRDSGSLEQDGDVVMFLYRDEYYGERLLQATDKPEEREKIQARLHDCRNQLEIIVAKQRLGRIGTVHLFYDVHIATITDLELHRDGQDSFELGA